MSEFKNPFDFDQKADRQSRKYAVAFVIVIVGVMLAFCGRQPAAAFQVPNRIETPWQHVDAKVCADMLKVAFVFQSIFAKAGMHGPLIFTTIKQPGVLPILQVTKRGAGFVFQTRWRKPLGFCLHSFRSIQRKSSESQ